MSQVIGEEFGTPDVTDFISGFDPRYDWLAEILDQYLTYVGGPEYTGLGDDRQYLPEEVQEIRELLAALEAGEEIDLESIRNDYPLLADYIEATSPDITIDQPTVPEQETEQDTTIDIGGAIDSLLDKFPTWEDLWNKVQDQLPSDPKEWGDVIRAVIEATGIDLPSGNVWDIMKGGYGVIYNPAGGSFPTGVFNPANTSVYIPGIPVGLPPNSTIIGTIEDLIQDPSAVLEDKFREVLETIQDPEAILGVIFGEDDTLPNWLEEAILAGTYGSAVVDWFENTFGSDDAASPPVVGDQDEEEEETGVSYGPDNPRPDDAFYQEVDTKDPTQYSTVTTGDTESWRPELADDNDDFGNFDDTTIDDDNNDLNFSGDDTFDDSVFSGGGDTEVIYGDPNQEEELTDQLSEDSGGGAGGAAGGGDFTPFYSGISYQTPTIPDLIQNRATDYSASLNDLINRNSGMFA